ncbi:hypothetical protein [uncultured Metabacillus sp.]|uniref:beta barrel domain-containing protein n=1 Tax=uncultured Metabacillus sp. TaxID=2860135 RepID=UPI002608C917|nr:hypothetical protein [uncultured Metabacillus sp.]
MSKDKIIVGQKVYLKPVNNAARYGNKEIREQEIVKVGRKYFFVGSKGEARERWMIKFSIEDLRQVTEYANDWELYFSEQEILDEEETEEIWNDLRLIFGSYGRPTLSLDKLRRIKEIVSE